MTTDLLDISVWLPLSAPDHVHHGRARQYWDQEAADVLAFTRVTSLGLLRLLTNRQVMGERALRSIDAWPALGAWLSTPRVTTLAEPPGLDDHLGRSCAEMDLRGGDLTDAYLAAFAMAGGCRLVTFDGDFHRYAGLTWLRLAA